MAERRRIGSQIIGTITEVKGKCSWGHTVGDKMDISGHDCGGLCGFFFHDIFPIITMLQFGGGYPWGNPDVVQVECMDRHNLVKMSLQRIREPGQ